MRIIGGHDYYDSALGYGIDPNLVLIRHKKNILDPSLVKRSGVYHNIATFWLKSKNNPQQKIQSNFFCIGDTWYRIHLLTVYVAGKKYGGIKVTSYSIEPDQFFWSWNKFQAWCDFHNLSCSCHEGYNALRRKDTDNPTYFTPRPMNSAETELFIQERISILTNFEERDDNRNAIWYVNPFHLHSIDFAKAVDPFSMFQELSMWIGSMGAEGNPMVQITDDKIKAEKHGFDKWSFRKPPKK